MVTFWSRESLPSWTALSPAMRMEIFRVLAEGTGTSPSRSARAPRSRSCRYQLVWKGRASHSAFIRLIKASMGNSPFGDRIITVICRWLDGPTGPAQGALRKRGAGPCVGVAMRLVHDRPQGGVTMSDSQSTTETPRRRFLKGAAAAAARAGALSVPTAAEAQ